jgi:hypothetical protein
MSRREGFSQPVVQYLTASALFWLIVGVAWATAKMWG